MRRLSAVLAALLLTIGLASSAQAAPHAGHTAHATALAAAGTPMQVYGAWHCGNDACTWATVRDMTNFDTNNHWLIDRGAGHPSLNLVVLAFVDPLRLQNATNAAGDVNGVPRR